MIGGAVVVAVGLALLLVAVAFFVSI